MISISALANRRHFKGFVTRVVLRFRKACGCKKDLNSHKNTIIKIIAVFDEKHWSQGAIELGCNLSKLSHSSLTGIFPGYPDEENLEIPLLGNEAASLLLSKEQKGTIENTISRFQQACLQQDVNTVIQCDSGAIGSDLKTESLFADVIIVDEAISFSDEDNKADNYHLNTCRRSFLKAFNKRNLNDSPK